MISNQKEYKITENSLKGFIKAVDEFDLEEDAKKTRLMFEIASLKSEVEILSSQMAEYEGVLRSHRPLVRVGDYYPVLLKSKLIEVRLKGGDILSPIDGKEIDVIGIDNVIEFDGMCIPGFLYRGRPNFISKLFGSTEEKNIEKRWRKALKWCKRKNEYEK